MGILFGGNRCRIAFAGWLPSGIPGQAVPVDRRHRALALAEIGCGAGYARIAHCSAAFRAALREPREMWLLL
ncbi:hypothetical protein I547_6990 [Mycobacterium kansasii 824]|nr:hypothetical protein I547_6990 [Mycobacterium kansasii 824]